MFNTFRAALSFLSRLPVGKLPELSDKKWADVPLFFPLIGYILGGLSLIPALVITRISEEQDSTIFLLASALSISLLAYLTRGLHLDGLADMADAYGVWTKEQRLEVMKDSNCGAFAVITLVLHLLLKVIAFSIVLDNIGGMPLLGVVIFSRFLILLSSRLGTYPREKGTGSFIVGKVSGKTLFMSLLFVLPLFGITLMWCAMLVMVILMFMIQSSAQEKLGGITGDVLGATCELTELVGLLTLAMVSL